MLTKKEEITSAIPSKKDITSANIFVPPVCFFVIISYISKIYNIFVKNNIFTAFSFA